MNIVGSVNCFLPASAHSDRMIFGKRLKFVELRAVGNPSTIATHKIEKNDDLFGKVVFLYID